MHTTAEDRFTGRHRMSDEEDSASLSGPSSEQGEDDASSEEEEEEEEGEEAPPPIQLPDRTSRGKRMGQVSAL